MSEDAALINSRSETEIPSTRGMTTKVVKGSIWTLIGQVLPMFASLISTPFVIRFLGAESYGVLILVGLIPNYFAFADLGMGIASTKFGSEAYGQGLKKREGEIVRAAALIAFTASLIFALPIFLFSFPLVKALEVPEYLQAQASVALKITAISYLIGILVSIINTPQLSRLRMDLNSIVNGGAKLILAIATPLVLLMGGQIIAAALVSLIAAGGGFAAHLFFSGRLLNELFVPTINKNHFKPLLKFGTGLLLSSLAGILLVNLEKIFLTKLVSVKSLAYYTVAFTFANMATMFSWAMVQSLIPAFSQLLTPEKKDEFKALFARALRLNVIWLLPAVMFLFVIAKPFFTVWAGEEFGRESSLPFYFLLIGLLFNIVSYVPYSSITASGRTDILAKVYWIELVPYIICVFLLINYFGIAGAALAWSLRVMLDAFVLIWLSKKIVGASYETLNRKGVLAASFSILSIPVFFAFGYDNFSLWLVPLGIVCGSLYALLIWKTFVENDEKKWIKSKIKNLLR